jgi:hypothetical protein
VLVEVDLLADLPSSINITLPNGVSKPRWCYMNLCHVFARGAKLQDIQILLATNLLVISAKKSPNSFCSL